jgi:hypothetical protein
MGETEEAMVVYKNCQIRKVTNEMLVALGWVFYIAEFEDGREVEEYRCRHFKSVQELKDYIDRHPEMQCQPSS